MAIKGKKKTKGQARRRPAQAPRPQIRGTDRHPWYRTPAGRVAAAVALVLVIALVAAAIAKVVGDANERQQAQTAAGGFVDDVRRLQQEVSPAGTGMMLAPATPDEPAFEALGDEAKEWVETFETAQTGSVEIEAPPDLEGALQVFRQSLALYAGAARTYRLAVRLDGNDAERALAVANEQRDRATAVWSTGILLVDKELVDLGRQPSGLGVPAELPQGVAPGGQDPVEIEPGEDLEDGSGEGAEDGAGDGADE